jgi:anaerobic selenocysteine-containing dehydrogenase
MKARERGATVIHVDPRFSRTSAMADLHVPIRARSDIAFLGGLIRHVSRSCLKIDEDQLRDTRQGRAAYGTADHLPCKHGIVEVELPDAVDKASFGSSSRTPTRAGRV